MDKSAVLKKTEELLPKAEKAAFSIFDNPEIDGEEFFAAELLSGILKNEGFEIEMGIAGLKTAFRAVYKVCGGGINIGILGEFDALRDNGHRCGHHMQSPAAIMALVAIREFAESEKIPCTLTFYGCPAEETFGGKIKMAESGFFKELDIALGTHASRKFGVTGTTINLVTYTVTYKGISAHVASPYNGRSAMDAMILTFNGLEFLREHIKTSARLSYSIRETVMPANLVNPRAVADISVRSHERDYLYGDLIPRIEKVIKGATMMTETTYEKFVRSEFSGTFPNKVLNKLAIDNIGYLAGEKCDIDINGKQSNGATDFGSVCYAAPTVYMHIPYCDTPSHSQEWYDFGKSEKATACIRDSAKLLASMIYDIITNNKIAEEARIEFENR